MVSIDEKINVVILDFDEEKTRIALGLKQLMPHPWDALDPNLKEGDIVHGRVVVITDYGAFVEVIPDVYKRQDEDQFVLRYKVHSAYLVCIEIVSLLRCAPINKEERLGGQLCDPTGLTAHTPQSLH